MHLIVAEILTYAGAERRYEKLLRKVVRALSEEPCFVRFSIARSTGDPRLFLGQAARRTRPFVAAQFSATTWHAGTNW
jgi:hypothetical protein